MLPQLREKLADRRHVQAYMQHLLLADGVCDGKSSNSGLKSAHSKQVHACDALERLTLLRMCETGICAGSSALWSARERAFSTHVNRRYCG